MHALALTDRDGLYGAVKFAQACDRAKIAPIIGTDLAVEPSGLIAGLPSWADPGAVRRPSRVPVRGGASVDPRHPRVTVLALGRNAELQSGAGWGQLCRLITATHLRGERGQPVSTFGLITEHAVRDEAPALVVMLGPGSEFGRAALARRPDLALAVLSHWQAALPERSLVVEIVCHHGPEGTPGSRGHAVRMLQLARRAGVGAVLTNAVRHATRDGAVTVDVLDSARRLVALDGRHLDRTTAEGYLAASTDMAARAHEIAEAAGGLETAQRLLDDTHHLAQLCILSSTADLGLGSIHLPEDHMLDLLPGKDALGTLRTLCEDKILTRYPAAHGDELQRIRERLDAELIPIQAQGIPAYFLTVAKVCGLIQNMKVRAAARGSGAGSLVNHLLGISGVDPMRYGLLMERFFTSIRMQLPDIDIDVESARRTEVYEQILETFGGERVTCVSMMDTYRVRHAIRDAGAALGMPPGEIDSIAKSFPHISARDVRHAIAELPELQATGLGEARLDLLFELVERLDGLPRHIALHPCGVVLSDSGLLDRTPVEASWLGFPMSQFDKDDVEEMGLLKLDVLGIRMQSAMAYAVDEVARVDGDQIDLDAVPLDDGATFELIRTAHTLGCFQIESPGQRELVGKFAPETFYDLIIDISLFRPGPVKSDMIEPFLRARQGWAEPEYVHPWLEGALADTYGVVVFHEQVLQIIDVTTGCGLDHADEVRRAMGSPEGQAEVKRWLVPHARQRGLDEASIQRIWEVLEAFASFGFCKAHAAAFALPTYQSSWLKAHHPAAFLAGVLTHDPGMYPKRLILDDARNLGITVLGLDVNRSGASYRVERLEPDQQDPEIPRPEPGLPDGRPYGIRLSLSEVKGINEAEVERVVAGQPFGSLADFWHRAQVSRPIAERLVMIGAFDGLYGISDGTVRLARDQVTRRDLLLQLRELERWTKSASAPPRQRRHLRMPAPGDENELDRGGIRQAAARQSQAALPVTKAADLTVQLALDLGDAPEEIIPSGLPEMSGAERVRAELDMLGLDATRHVLDFYLPMLDALGVVRSRDVLRHRSRAELLVAGVKVATQTPPVRTGRRVVFLTLDDATGPVDATFFEDAQGPYASTVFHSWLLVVRGVLRRTGPRGASLRATGAWELPLLWESWHEHGIGAVHDLIAAAPDLSGAGWRKQPMPSGLPAAAYDHGVVVPAAAGQSAPGRTQGTGRDDGALGGAPADGDWEIASGLPAGDRLHARTHALEGGHDRAGGMGGGRRRVLVHPSGYRQSPYADLKPPGADTKETRQMLAAEEEATREHQERRKHDPPRKLWHSSPGSSGH